MGKYSSSLHSPCRWRRPSLDIETARGAHAFGRAYNILGRIPIGLRCCRTTIHVHLLLLDYRFRHPRKCVIHLGCCLTLVTTSTAKTAVAAAAPHATATAPGVTRIMRVARSLLLLLIGYPRLKQNKASPRNLLSAIEDGGCGDRLKVSNQIPEEESPKHLRKPFDARDCDFPY